MHYLILEQFVIDGQIIRILAIDDDPALHCLLERALVRHGYQVTTATDGVSGLAELMAKSFDLLIVDYDMPGYTGIDVLRRLTVEYSLPPPLIMLTGKGNERVAVEALKLGAADYLVKDVDLAFLELLPPVIHRVLTRRRLEVERDSLFAGIKESEERYRRLVEMIPDGIAILVDGRIVLINPAGLGILGGGSLAELLGTEFFPWLRLLPSSGGHACNSGDDAISTLDRWQELACRRRNGEQMYVELLRLRFTYQGKNATQILFRDVTDKKLYQERLEHLATFDVLTELPNRMLFFERFQQILASALRYADVGALLYMDLDGFKAVNDTLGHDAGDTVLQVIADRLREGVRQADVVARMGGDEFTVLLTKLAHSADAGEVAGKILHELRQPICVADREVTLGASIGISVFPQDGATMEELLKLADLAMYAAKRAGGYQYCFAAAAGSEPVP
jgi:diguanylate cyclase (GGDEF)-like protein/PAS domain S-box-containing protein